MLQTNRPDGLVAWPIAQSVEQQTFNWWVGSSRLSGPTSVNEMRLSGSVENHFASEAKLVLDISPQPGDGFIAPGATQTPAGDIRVDAPLTHKEFADILHLSLRSANQ
jgi:L-threonylcarbamoyladenylate synthase